MQPRLEARERLREYSIVAAASGTLKRSSVRALLRGLRRDAVGRRAVQKFDPTDPEQRRALPIRVEFVDG